MTSTSVARADARGPSPPPDQGRDDRAVDGTDQRRHQLGAHRAAGTFDHLDDGLGALLHDAALDVAQSRVAAHRRCSARSARSTARRPVFPDRRRPTGRPGRRPSTRPRACAADSAATRVFSSSASRMPTYSTASLDEVVERREVVRRRGQRQPRAAGDGAVPDGVEAALAQQIGGRADQRVPSSFSLGGDCCRHALHAASNGPAAWGFRPIAKRSTGKRCRRWHDGPHVRHEPSRGPAPRHRRRRGSRGCVRTRLDAASPRRSPRHPWR